MIRRIVRVLGCAVLAVSCNETTAPVRRYPLLDEVGQSDWQSVTAGGDHTCALKLDGTAYCWGSNRYGQLGIPRNDTTCGTGISKYGCSLTPQRVATTVRFIALSAGQRHTCGITADRDAYCWGANDESQLGGFGATSPTLSRVDGALPWTQISAGVTHTCAVRSDGALFCWGQSERGEIGNGSLFTASTPTRVEMDAPVAAVSAGQSRTCARTVIGTVYCWGAIWLSRENGLELSRTQTRPQLVPGAPSMSWISVGAFTTCGTDFSGFAYCWEANPRGSIGDGSLDGSTTPKRVATDLEFVQLSAGVVQTCGVTISGAGYCWGDDSFGQLGVATSSVVERCVNGALPCSTRPIPVIGRQAFTEISTGAGSHACGVTTRGNLYCWGLGVSGQRGDGTMTNSAFTPVTVVEPNRAR
jgi:alpha-tubulin suppressor-like RCC1 family protein